MPRSPLDESLILFVIRPSRNMPHPQNRGRVTAFIGLIASRSSKPVDPTPPNLDGATGTIPGRQRFPPARDSGAAAASAEPGGNFLWTFDISVTPGRGGASRIGPAAANFGAP